MVFCLWRSPSELRHAVDTGGAAGARVVVVSDQGPPVPARRVDELVLVPGESASMFPSLTAMMAIVDGVLAALVAHDEVAARRASERVEASWTTYGLFPPQRQ